MCKPSIQVGDAAPQYSFCVSAVSFLTLTTTTTSTAIMCKHNSSPLLCLLCEHSGTTLATFAGVGPSALPASLRGHPIWGCLALKCSAYERDCMVADAHRYGYSSHCKGYSLTTDVEHSLRKTSPPSPRGRKTAPWATLCLLCLRKLPSIAPEYAIHLTLAQESQFR